jgi:CBS domain-containing protein
MDKSSVCCFEDQTIAQAELIMLKAKVGQVLVVTVQNLLLGTINIGAIAQEKERSKRWDL